MIRAASPWNLSKVYRGKDDEGKEKKRINLI